MFKLIRDLLWQKFLGKMKRILGLVSEAYNLNDRLEMRSVGLTLAITDIDA
ncbi:hypothetical protein SAMN04487995_2467 [Dyadobacter koreensis]|uniref:Uncharacterized protein n=1 Tax=Dyadobacter koreensis TaxID=408657 RepID=A0A1H6TX54_9BACT|nr:hypothetical protein SAMN04487995_2467 [Dyadobacter koreensis]